MVYGIQEFQGDFVVPNDALEKLKIYHALLLKWQKTINLVSNSTIDNSWERHFSDSAQLAQYIDPQVETLADIGSGAGFPGLVLAILCPNIKVHLIESDHRKAQFLKTVSRETQVNAEVHNTRIEDCAEIISPDVVTARALASLDKLLALTYPWAQQNESLALCFLKGETAADEINTAQNTHSFTHERHESITQKNASIMLIKNVKAL